MACFAVPSPLHVECIVATRGRYCKTSPKSEIIFEQTKTLLKVLIPATLPYMFAGFWLSLGIAWLVIVAAEMLTGRPRVGGFLWQEYNALNYSRIILCILTIGLVGFALDRLTGSVERRFKTA